MDEVYCHFYTPKRGCPKSPLCTSVHPSVCPSRNFALTILSTNLLKVHRKKMVKHISWITTAENSLPTLPKRREKITATSTFLKKNKLRKRVELTITLSCKLDFTDLLVKRRELTTGNLFNTHIVHQRLTDEGICR